jgi:hypothetical protein
MNASAIYSKSGKGVQEASGKTSQLSRSDRAVLSAIDGRATLGDVAQKVGKPYDAAFLKLIDSLDKGGFIRQVSAGSPSAPVPGAAAKPAAKAAPTPLDAASDLDFTTALSIPRAKPPAPAPAPAPAPSAQEKSLAERAAKEQQEAFQKAREEAERKAAAERERVKAEADARLRAEAEVKARSEAEARLKAEAEAKAKAQAEAKVKAAQEAAARATAAAKAKAEAEAKKAREEAERARKEAAEAAERARKEAEEKMLREQEELRRKLEEERKAREEAERKAQELEDERRKLEDERRRREQEETMQAARAAASSRAAAAAAAKAAAADEPAPPRAPAPAPVNPASGAFSDSLLADLETFSTRDDEERKQKEEALAKEREAALALAREVQERRAREEAERKTLDDKERRKREEAERKAREEAELREREERDRERLREEEERRRAEAEERARKAKEEEQLAANALRQQAYDAEMRAKRERDLKTRGRKTPAAARAAQRAWGKPIAITLFLLLVVGVAVLHIMPIDTTEYERAASQALGRPVKARSANLSLVTGPSIKFSDVSVGDGIRIPVVRAYPQWDALVGPRKAFSRIELEGLKIEQQALGDALFIKLDSPSFAVGRFVARNVELTGPLALPKGLELEVVYDDDGAVRAAVVRGPDALNARLTRRRSNLDIDMSAASLTLPFAPEITLSRFSMKGAATPQGLTVSEWDGSLLNGTLSGTASVRWGDSWVVDGVLTARNINAAVFAPALLSDGKGEGSGKFSMRGAPGKLAATSRLDGSFTVTRGVLGSIDLSRAIQTQGKSATGRTQFNEMNGQATYDRGAVSLRNVTIGAGQLNAGASADISQNGALSGRIVADVRVASQTLRATLNLGGTVKEPQVRN